MRHKNILACFECSIRVYCTHPAKCSMLASILNHLILAQYACIMTIISLYGGLTKIHPNNSTSMHIATV